MQRRLQRRSPDGAPPRGRRRIAFAVRAAICWSTAALGVALLAGCAPDAFRRDPAFENWIQDVDTACRRARIGPVSIGDLLGNTGSREGAYFLNQTSRLYSGQITPPQWTSGVTAFISGRPSDPGVKCVLDQLPKK